MEIPKNISSILLTLACVLFVTGLIKVLNWVWLRPKRIERWLRQQGICGTSYKLYYGDTKELASMRAHALETPMSDFSNDHYHRVQPYHYHLVSKFGKNYFFWRGPTPMVNISSPDLLKEALTKVDTFQKPSVNPIADKLFPGLLNYEGEKWTRVRKIINPAFHVEKLKLMLPAFHDSCVDMISIWEDIIAERGFGELDVWPSVSTLGADAISRAAFGSSYKEGQQIFELLKKQGNMVLAMLQSVYIPSLKYFPTAQNRQFNKIDNQIEYLLRRIIDKRMEAIEAGEPPKTDLLGILLDSNTKKENQNRDSNVKQQSQVMSTQDIIDECKLFYLAGQETTSSLLVWTLLLLSKHQDWQARAREEVLQTFGTNIPDFEGLSQLKKINMILYEVLRLYPPANPLTRKIYKDTKLGTVLLPAGTLVTFPTMFVHQDKEFWDDDAQEFKPERFSKGVSKATKGNNSFFPFGWGPRICIGEKFAMTEVKFALSMMLQRFSFELSPNYVHAPMMILILQPQYGARIILRML